MGKLGFGILLGILAPSLTWATPSTTYWSVTTANCQAFAVPHFTYDSYFGRGPTIGLANSPGLPTDTGFTVGFLPFSKLQAEFGVDMLFPTTDPFMLSGKVCVPEDAGFGGSPSLGVGIYNVGTRVGSTDYNVVYAVLQKSFSSIGGSLALGFYYGLNPTLLRNSDGVVVQSGLLASITSPDIQIGLKGLKKLNLVADIQSGKNILGAWGVGAGLYFTDAISVLTGPVFFLDKAAQPGSSEVMWTLQLDVDLDLKKL